MGLLIDLLFPRPGHPRPLWAIPFLVACALIVAVRIFLARSQTPEQLALIQKRCERCRRAPASTEAWDLLDTLRVCQSCANAMERTHRAGVVFLVTMGLAGVVFILQHGVAASDDLLPVVGCLVLAALAWWRLRQMRHAGSRER
jgi:hypothetical protein